MNLEDRIYSLEEKCRKMERKNRQLIIVFMIFGFMALSIIWPTGTAVAQQEAREIRANRFVLEDDKGHARGWMAMTDDGPVITFWSDKGAPAFGLSVTNDNRRAISFYDASGTARMVLSSDDSGSTLSFHDGQGVARAGLKLEELVSSMFLSDDGGEVRLFKPL